MEPILGNKSFYSRTERMLPVISTIWEIVVINQFNVRPRASPNCTPVRTVGADLLDEEGADQSGCSFCFSRSFSYSPWNICLTYRYNIYVWQCWTWCFASVKTSQFFLQNETVSLIKKDEHEDKTWRCFYLLTSSVPEAFSVIFSVLHTISMKQYSVFNYLPVLVCTHWSG